jgi:hypothetical protein
VSTTQNYIPEDHAELVYIADLRSGALQYTGKSYPTPKQAKGLLRIPDLETHFTDLNDQTALVLGCHDLTIFHPRSDAKAKGWRASIKKAFKKIAIEGHASSEGNADFNRTLSDNRAKAVRQYLISQGIAEDTLTAKGFGADKPRTINHKLVGSGMTFTETLPSGTSPKPSVPTRTRFPMIAEEIPKYSADSGAGGASCAINPQLFSPPEFLP